MNASNMTYLFKLFLSALMLIEAPAMAAPMEAFELLKQKQTTPSSIPQPEQSESGALLDSGGSKGPPPFNPRTKLWDGEENEGGHNNNNNNNNNGNNANNGGSDQSKPTRASTGLDESGPTKHIANEPRWTLTPEVGPTGAPIVYSPEPGSSVWLPDSEVPSYAQRVKPGKPRPGYTAVRGAKSYAYKMDGGLRISHAVESSFIDPQTGYKVTFRGWTDPSTGAVKWETDANGIRGSAYVEVTGKLESFSVAGRGAEVPTSATEGFTFRGSYKNGTFVWDSDAKGTMKGTRKFENGNIAEYTKRGNRVQVIVKNSAGAQIGELTILNGVEANDVVKLSAAAKTAPNHKPNDVVKGEKGPGGNEVRFINESNDIYSEMNDPGTGRSVRFQGRIMTDGSIVWGSHGYSFVYMNKHAVRLSGRVIKGHFIWDRIESGEHKGELRAEVVGANGEVDPTYELTQRARGIEIKQFVIHSDGSRSLKSLEVAYNTGLDLNQAPVTRANSDFTVETPNAHNRLESPEKFAQQKAAQATAQPSVQAEPAAKAAITQVLITPPPSAELSAELAAEFAKGKPSRLQETLALTPTDLDQSRQALEEAKNPVSKIPSESKMPAGPETPVRASISGATLTIVLAYFMITGMVQAYLSAKYPHKYPAGEWGQRTFGAVHWASLGGFMVGAFLFMKPMDWARTKPYWKGRLPVYSGALFFSMFLSEVSQLAVLWSQDSDFMKCMDYYYGRTSPDQVVACDRHYDRWVRSGYLQAHLLGRSSTALVAGLIAGGVESVGAKVAGQAWKWMKANRADLATKIGGVSEIGLVRAANGTLVTKVVTAAVTMSLFAFSYEIVDEIANFEAVAKSMSILYGDRNQHTQNGLVGGYALLFNQWEKLRANGFTAPADSKYSMDSALMYVNDKNKQWRLSQMRSTRKQFQDWIGRVNKFNSMREWSFKAYKDVVDMTEEQDALGPDWLSTNIDAYNETEAAGLLSADLPKQIGQVKINSLYEYLFTSMACGIETEENKTDDRGILTKAWDAMHAGSPTPGRQSVVQQTEASWFAPFGSHPELEVHFLPPRIVKAQNNNYDICHYSLTGYPDTPARFFARSDDWISSPTSPLRKRNGVTLSKYILIEIRPNILVVSKDQKVNSFEQWWNSTVVMQVNDALDTFDKQYKTEVILTYRNEILSKNGTCVPYISPEGSKVPALMTKMMDDPQECSAMMKDDKTGSLYLATGGIASIKQEYGIYHTMLNDLFIGQGDKTGIFGGDATLKAAWSERISKLDETFNKLTDEKSFSAPNKEEYRKDLMSWKAQMDDINARIGDFCMTEKGCSFEPKPSKAAAATSTLSTSPALAAALAAASVTKNASAEQLLAPKADELKKADEGKNVPNQKEIDEKKLSAAIYVSKFQKDLAISVVRVIGFLAAEVEQSSIINSSSVQDLK